MPLTTTRPLQAKSTSTAFSKLPSSRSSSSPAMACASICSTRRARFEAHDVPQLRTSSPTCFNLFSRAASCESGKAFEPSESAAAGFSCVSRKIPSTPAARSGARQCFDKFRLASAGVALAAGQLHRVGHVIDHGVSEFLHYRKRAHVHYQIVIAEGGAALGEDNVVDFPRRQFFLLRCPFPREKGTGPFLTLIVRPVLARGHQQIGLARQKRGNLQHVADFRGGSGLGALMNISEDRHVKLFFDFRQDAQAFRGSRAAKRFQRRAVGLVIGGLENIRYAAIGGDARDLLGHRAGVGFAFNHARPGNQE